MKKKPQKQSKKRLLRIPVKLDKELQERAEQNQRSVNGQIIYELDQK